VTAVREADLDGNPETEPDAQWSSFIPTPPFPDYTSGHSTFSRAAATVLASFFGTDEVAFTTTSDGLPGVVRSYPGFSAAADEAGISRIFGGIHFPSANLHAQGCGYQIAKQLLAYFLQPVTALQFTRVLRSGDGTEVEVHAEPNRSYLIRASSDLRTWETIAKMASADGVLRFTDRNAGDLQLRFYDVVAE
jgi:hypothetical protein